MGRSSGVRRRLLVSLGAVAATVAANVAGAAPADAAITYRTVYVHVTCNAGYYPSAVYSGSYWQYVTYYGYDGYWFSWSVRLDTGVASSQPATFTGYCNSMSGKPQYRKGSRTVTVSTTQSAYYVYI